MKGLNWVDQILHMFIGALIVLVLGFIIHPAFAVLISMAVGVAREMWQHPWKCHTGCRTDLLFWFIGSLVQMVLMITT